MTARTIAALHGKDAHGGVTLRAPKLGLYSDHPRDGCLVEPGSPIGTLTQLGNRFLLVVPEGVAGRVVVSGRPHDQLPVGYGDVLFGIEAFAGLADVTVSGDTTAAGSARNELSIVAPTDGVFYRAPSIDAKPYVAVGDRVTVGRPVGLIEVMKTFNPIAYGGAGFPDEAEVIEIVASDAQEVRAGQALVVVKTL